MKRTTKSLLVSAVVLLFAGLLLALCSSMYVKMHGIDAFGIASVEPMIENKTLSLADILADSKESDYNNKLSELPFTKVDVISYAGDVIVRSGKETSVELQHADTNNLSLSVVGNTLTVREMEPVGFLGVFADESGFSFKGLRQIFGPGNTLNTEKVIIVTIGEDVALESLTVLSTLGDVTIDKASAEAVNVESNTGNVCLINMANSEASISVKGNFTGITLENCLYDACNLSTKIGKIYAVLNDTTLTDLTKSIVLDSWMGDVSVYTHVPVDAYKLSISTAFGAVSKNGEALGKECKNHSISGCRISSTVYLGNVLISYADGDESQYREPAVENPPETSLPQTGVETPPQTGTTPPLTGENATQGANEF